jgi:hypothetical protein
MGSFPLYGLDRTSWDKENERDLVTLRSRKTVDPFSHWFANKVIPAFHHLIGTKFKTPMEVDFGAGLYEYNDSILRTIARFVATTVATILPLLSVVVLYVIKANVLRLGVIIILSAFFSLALAVMTNARKIELFAATSA